MSSHLIDRLSHAALEHVATLRLADVSQAAARLYFYNRIPLSSRWWRLWPDGEAVVAHLGVGSSGVLPGGLVAVRLDNPAWVAWRRPEATAPGRHKLYVSPLPSALAESFQAVLDVARATPPWALKVGADAAGLLRPDKFVLYFEHPDEPAAFAAALSTATHGVAVQGVPFTTPADATGLLSTGVDPADSPSRPMFSEASWRVVVCTTLAEGLLESKRAAVEARVAAAYRRARSTGIDVASWTRTAP